MFITLRGNLGLILDYGTKGLGIRGPKGPKNSIYLVSGISISIVLKLYHNV